MVARIVRFRSSVAKPRARFLSLVAALTGLVLIALPNPSLAELAAPEPNRVVLRLPEDAVASVPSGSRDASRRPPLIIILHGAGQSPDDMLDLVKNDPACADAVLLVPKSRGPTWDVVAMAQRQAMEGISLSSDVLKYSSSKDADRVMSAIGSLETQVGTDPTRRVLVGFSDGATFALALGTGRDRPFTAVIALSPGLAVVPTRAARRRDVLVMHGRRDRSLSFDFTQGTIVPTLRSAGMNVRFVPFPGGHEVAPGWLSNFTKMVPSFIGAAVPSPSTIP